MAPFLSLVITMTDCSITLLLSGLPPIPSEGEPQPLPALQSLLSKGRQEGLPASEESLLFDLFCLPVQSQGDLPVAALSALGSGIKAQTGWWLCADPVHLVADRDQLFLSASQALGVSQAEADELVAELNRLYADDGWHFFSPSPQHWYLRLPEPLAMQTVPTSEVMGRRVGEVLPQGEEAMAWQRVMTEVQMVLHSSRVNARRAERGEMAINGLWFWGGGSLPQASGERCWDRVVAETPFALGLAQLHQLNYTAPSSTQLEFQLHKGGRILWQQMVSSLPQAEQQLFAPLLASLQSGELKALTIILPGIASWHLDRKALRRWWRRRQPLTALLKGLS